jgi:cobalt-zinc-cadmium efflux system outer membrane protein
MWASLTRLVVLTGVVLATGGTAVAQSPIAGGDRSIGFDEAVARTLESNPELRAFGYSIAAQQGRIEQAKQPPPVELDVEIENILGTGIYSGVQSSQTTLGLAWSLERGKREHRVAASEAGLTAIESEAELLRLDKAAETAHRYIETLALQARIELAVEAIRLAATMVDAVEQRVAAGRTPLADLARAKVELARREMEHDHLTHLHVTSIHRLAAQWGETSPAFGSVSGDLADLPVVDTFEALMARTGQNPQMRRLLNEQRLREAELRRAESEARLDWQVLAGVRHLEDTNDQNFVALFRIPFGGEKRNAGNVARARANLDRNDADRVTTRIKVETELFALYSELKHSLHIANTLRERILPNVDVVLTETRRAYEAGRYSYLELRIAQDEALRAREDYLNALIETHRYAIDIEALTGTALSSPARR